MKYFEKQSRIFGASPSDYVSHNIRIPLSESIPGYEKYLEDKSYESPTSMSLALGVGGGVGTLLGLAGLNSKYFRHVRTKWPIPLTLGLIGAATGGILRQKDHSEIDTARNILASGNKKELIRQKLIDYLDTYDIDKNKKTNTIHI